MKRIWECSAEAILHRVLVEFGIILGSKSCAKVVLKGNSKSNGIKEGPKSGQGSKKHAMALPRTSVWMPGKDVGAEVIFNNLEVSTSKPPDSQMHGGVCACI
jgi:hypothetical protein